MAIPRPLAWAGSLSPLWGFGQDEGGLIRNRTGWTDKDGQSSAAWGHAAYRLARTPPAARSRSGRILEGSRMAYGNQVELSTLLFRASLASCIVSRDYIRVTVRRRRDRNASRKPNDREYRERYHRYQPKEYHTTCLQTAARQRRFSFSARQINPHRWSPWTARQIPSGPCAGECPQQIPRSFSD